MFNATVDSLVERIAKKNEWFKKLDIYLNKLIDQNDCLLIDNCKLSEKINTQGSISEEFKKIKEEIFSKERTIQELKLLNKTERDASKDLSLKYAKLEKEFNMAQKHFDREKKRTLQADNDIEKCRLEEKIKYLLIEANKLFGNASLTYSNPYIAIDVTSHKIK